MRTEETMQRADRGGLVRPRLETMAAVTSTARQKALSLNLDRRTYGTLAEIGAGQEVARWFFQVGGAAGTVAKSISAHDMVVSDGLCGEAYLSIRTPDVLARIERGDPSWERLVPPAVADIIKARKLFGWAEALGPAGRVQGRSAGDAG